MVARQGHGAIVVGVGPHGLAPGTISLVVEAAEHLGLNIELVHVLPTPDAWPSGLVETGVALVELAKAGRAALASAADLVRAEAGTSRGISARLVHDGVVPGLVDHGRHARLLVLERHDHSRWERALTGETIARIAAHAETPVVSVPAGWLPSQRTLPITVGCEDADRAAAELWTALGLAAATDRPVRVVRVTYLPQAYQEILRREVRQRDFLDATRHELARDAALPAEVCEGVGCQFEARWGRPSEVLVELSSSSSLIVLARRDPRLPIGSHLGPVVREVLRASRCPVMVVEPTLREPVRLAERRHAAAV